MLLQGVVLEANAAFPPNLAGLHRFFFKTWVNPPKNHLFTPFPLPSGEAADLFHVTNAPENSCNRRENINRLNVREEWLQGLRPLKDPVSEGPGL